MSTFSEIIYTLNIEKETVEISFIVRMSRGWEQTNEKETYTPISANDTQKLTDKDEHTEYQTVPT